jgi:hypothetical protein
MRSAATAWIDARLAPPRLPGSFDAWMRRCEELLLQFEHLEGTAAEGEPGQGQPQRRAALAALREEGARPGLHLALVGSLAPDASWAPQLQQALDRAFRQDPPADSRTEAAHRQGLASLPEVLQARRTLLDLESHPLELRQALRENSLRHIHLHALDLAP